MSEYKIIDDQPASSKEDTLEFKNLISVIEDHVFNRDEISPLVVGIYGKWGTGKTTLMNMAIEKLGKPNYKGKWIPIRFSPWKYRNEKNLLLPLLVTIAQNDSKFKKLFTEIVDSGSSLIKMLSKMGIDAATTGLPLLTLLTNVNKENKKSESLEEKIEKNIIEITKNKRIAFFIDDLDRCHGSGQIIGLLEQIQQFLHLNKCVFFIGMDKKQIIKEIDKTYKDDGKNYLEKFVQIEFEIKPSLSNNLVEMFKQCINKENITLHQYLERIIAIYDFNPRKIKRIWNSAILSIEVLEKDYKATLHNHTPNIKLMLKWLLLSELDPIKNDPAIYLKYERESETFKTDRALIKLGLKNNDNKYISVFHQRLAEFLYYDLNTNIFKTELILNLYSRRSIIDKYFSIRKIQESLFEGNLDIKDKEFISDDLKDGNFKGAHFVNCDFKRANLSNTDLEDVHFEGCNMFGVTFDGTTIKNTKWTNCKKIDRLETEPVIYEIIADMIVEQSPDKGNYPDEFMQMYKTIIDRHSINNTLTDEIKKRLTAKGLKVRKTD